MTDNHRCICRKNLANLTPELERAAVKGKIYVLTRELSGIRASRGEIDRKEAYVNGELEILNARLTSLEKEIKDEGS